MTYAITQAADPDGAYPLIVEAHRGLSAEESAALNARLVLVLANQIGDAAVLAEAIGLASQGSGAPTSETRRAG